MNTERWNRLVEQCAAVADEWARTLTEDGDNCGVAAAEALATEIRKKKITDDA